MATFKTIYVNDIKSDGDINIIPGTGGETLLKENPISALGAATKSYVDQNVSLGLMNVTAATGPTYNILPGDLLISCRYSLTASQTITLPLISSVPIGKIYQIVDTDGNASVNNILITTSGADTINADTSLLLNGNYQSFSIYADRANKWFIF
jgi:hypothetical protein